MIDAEGAACQIEKTLMMLAPIEALMALFRYNGDNAYGKLHWWCKTIAVQHKSFSPIFVVFGNYVPKISILVSNFLTI